MNNLYTGILQNIMDVSWQTIIKFLSDSNGKHLHKYFEQIKDIRFALNMPSNYFCFYLFFPFYKGAYHLKFGKYIFVALHVYIWFDSILR